jgi:uncharacterized protein
VAAPLDHVFSFFSKPANLGLITPAAMRFRIVGQVPVLTQGVTIDYRVRAGPFPISWRSRIVDWDPPNGFTDVQVRGPYRVWRHEHVFRAQGNTTVMDDRVYYAAPAGILGALANRLFIAPALREIFKYRADVIRMRFGSP